MERIYSMMRFSERTGQINISFSSVVSEDIDRRLFKVQQQIDDFEHKQ